MSKIFSLDSSDKSYKKTTVYFTAAGDFYNLKKLIM